MLASLQKLLPFTTPESQRLAMLFAVVYFAQGMYDLPTQILTFTMKDRFGLSAGQTATFFLIVTVPWFIKPVYGLISDFVPLFGRRRKSYLMLSSGLAAASGLTLALAGDHSYRTLAVFVTLMALGLAFTDVLVDALMVETGRPLGLTGAFQSIQWTAIYGASIFVGIVGGYFAARRNIHATFALAAFFPLISLTMAFLFIKEAPARADAAAFRRTAGAIREALGTRNVWVVGGFILFWNFSPSFGPAFFYYQTDTLNFSQQFIGMLLSLGAIGYMAGAILYAPLSRRVPLRRIIVWAIGAAVVGTLAYLLYRGPVSAMIIDTTFGCVGMITQLAFLDLAAKACPRRVEATFFALLMSISNLGTKGSQITGGYLYDWLGFTPLVLISAFFTALAWLLVPLVRIEKIEAQARADVTS